jgi:hypothetical protein
MLSGAVLRRFAVLGRRDEHGRKLGWAGFRFTACKEAMRYRGA